MDNTHTTQIPTQGLLNTKSDDIGGYICTLIKEAINKVYPDLSINLSDIKVDHPQNESFGDYSTNIAMTLVQIIKTDPVDIAAKIAKKILKDKIIENVSVVGGFINISLTPSWLKKQADSITKLGDTYGLVRKTNGKRIMIEFGQPNTHKMPHVGHLFSYTLGESLARLIESQGFTVFRANYQGDVGLHVAKCLWAYIQEKPSIPDTLLEKVQLLQSMYQKGSLAFDHDENIAHDIKELNRRIYEKDPSIFEIWMATRSWSIKFYKTFEHRIGTHFDRSYFESETFLQGKELVNQNIDSVFQKSDGAIIFKGSNYHLHDRVFITRYEVPTYEAKDLGLQVLKYKEWPFDRLIITTANEQNEYFKVIFKALEMIKPDLAGKLFHLGFGMLNLKTGKMSSRTGKFVGALDLVNMSIDKISRIIHEKPDFTEVERKNISEVVGLGAYKYSFLKSNPLQNVSFDLDESVSFEGNSGPYIQYTYTRAKSILSEVDKQNPDYKNYATGLSYQPNTEEMAILRTLYRYPYILSEATAHLDPHLVCTYLYDLAKKFNTFYKKHKVLKTDIPDSISFRITLTASTAQILKNGLRILGIETLEKM